MIGYFFAFLVAYGYASSNFYIKKGLANGSKDVGVFITILVNVSVALVLAVYIITKSPTVFKFPGIIFFVLSGLMGPILGRLTFYNAFNHVGITLASSIKIAAPVFAAVIAFFALNETLTLRAITGMFIVMLGLYLLSKQNNSNPDAPAGKNRSFMVGILFALASALSFATGNVFRKIGLQYIDSAVLGLAVSTCGSLVIYTVYFLIKGKFKEFTALNPAGRKDFIIGGLFTTLATFSYFLSLKTIPVAITVTIANTEPIFVIFLSKYVFKLADEPLNFRLFMNIAVIFSGVLLITFKG
ncbi:MAG: DMT family transporter [Peptococcaceae bacterium]